MKRDDFAAGLLLIDCTEGMTEIGQALKSKKPVSGYTRKTFEMSVISAGECGAEHHASAEVDLETGKRIWEAALKIIDERRDELKVVTEVKS